MPDMTTIVGGQTFGDTARTQPVDCAHLHNAFGPGCPYCRPTAGAERRGDQPDSSTPPHWVADELEHAEIAHRPEPDFRAVA
jgi:hypothetical protein